MSEDNTNPENTETLEAPETITRDEVIRMVNAAVSTHNKRLSKTFETQIATALGPIMEKLTVSETAEAPKAEESSASKEMKAQLEAMRAQLAAEKDQREAERSKRMVAEERDLLRTTLLNNGVPSDRVELAEAYLYDKHRRLERDDDGNIQFLVPEQGYTDRLPIGEGIAKFLKTDIGKTFLPPKDAGGSGSRGGSRPNTKADDSMAEADAVIAAYFGFSE